MIETDRKNRIVQLRKELRELLAAETPRSDWYAGFDALLRIDTHPYGDRVRIVTEHILGEEAPRMDYLILREDPGVRMEKAIFQIFRGHNILEYKNPRDALNERVIRKICGYANFYIGLAERGGGEIPPDQVTISIFRATKSEKLFQMLRTRNQLREDAAKGIYRVKGIVDLPFQIVITSELEGPDYAAYRALTDHATKADVAQVIRSGQSESDFAMQEHYRVFLDLIAKKNPKIIDEIRRDKAMETTWMEIFKDAIDERVNTGRQEERQDTLVSAIKNVMETFSVSAEKAMESLKIPQNQRAAYAELLNKS